ncbi:MAG: dipeptide epimerase [Caulobacteraceae bacterium]|nr:dipeptide epimerase [Caulobacteraceae bacterium]
MTRGLTAIEERWPIAGAFTIARGSKTEARVIVVEINEHGAAGRGEAVPYPRYGETVETSLAEIEAQRGAIEAGCGLDALQSVMPPGAARNALDCALWDLRAKQTGVRAWAQAGLAAPAPVTTAFTLSLASPEVMGAAAHAARDRPILKLKIGGADDLERVAAVRHAAPAARLIVDGNEGLSFDDLKRLLPDLHRLKVGLIEQPLKAGEDEALAGFSSPVPLCADESLHTRAELAVCAARYQAINIKLDKTGGLTEALALAREARALGLDLMIGCMVATSLSMAPALLLAGQAAWVDLDGPLLLARDRVPGLTYTGSVVTPPDPDLWG